MGAESVDPSGHRAGGAVYSRMWRGLALAGALVLLVLLGGPALVSAAWTNAGMLALRDGLLAQRDLAPGVYPVRMGLHGDAGAVRAMRCLGQSVALNKDGLANRWALGRAALAAGDVETAASALRPLAGKTGQNPLLYQDVLVALSHGGQPEEVVALYEVAPPLQPTQAISDVVALAYLDLLVAGPRDQGTRGQGDGEQPRRWLERAHALRPGDLYTNYRLWEEARAAGDAAATAAYSRTLDYFPLEAVRPTDERLLSYVAEAVPDLLAEGLWGREKALHVVSYLVWQHNGAAGVERLLQRLIERYPAEPDWPFYLAELHHRRGDLERAETAYRRVLAVDPACAQAYLRLGVLSEESCDLQASDCKENAAKWYLEYCGLARNDSLILKRLAGVCAAQEKEGMESESCREAAELVIEGWGDKGTGERRVGEERKSPADILRSEWLEQVATAEPEYLVGQGLDDGWMFLGYDVDQERLVRGEPVDLILYWSGSISASAGSEQDGWYRAGERWVQVLGGGQNLTLNGGFELGVEQDGSPAGFPGDIYRAHPDTRRLVADWRAGRQTTVALLDNTDVYSSTSFVSAWVPVDPDGLYLQTGWIRSAGGRAYLGRRWVGELARDVRAYSYAAAGVEAEGWQHYAGVTQPLPGTDRCQIWLLNYKALGQVYFDDVSFVEIGRPGT